VPVRYTEAFKRQLNRLSRKYRRIRTDIEPVIQSLEAGETPGDQIPGVGHPLYKVRVKNTDARHGQRGGYRLIYYLQTAHDALLVTIYSKTEQTDIDAADLKQILDEEGE